ncbi:GNAT family N-acetyltransferase [Paracoccus fontiphilus]|uniref:GNAT family N-acetyltransferase n=1 Tax=Paracoccus fontiphilus TaxID=1815556 RepID=A0ABV7IJM8_9RHOB|nr:GNAT family N-acetyltransferase [Paracoccus fontiphilus]
MTVAFRPARPQDVAAIVDLLADDILGQGREGAADLTPYLSAFEAIRDDPHNLLIVGEDDGAIVACYQITFITGLSQMGARRAQIEGVRVARDRRGKGIGATLIADAEQRARDADCRLMQFTTSKARDDAHRFYDRLGFTPSHIGYKKTL